MRVLHVLPSDLARGAQVYARALCDELDATAGDRHEIVTLFAGPSGAARPDFRLGVPPGPLQRAWRDPRAVWRLRRLVRQLQPDIVVAHGLDPFKYVSVLRGPVLVCLGIGVAYDKALRPLPRRLYSAALARADAFVGVSDEVVEQACGAFGVPRERARTIVNGRDPALFVSPTRDGTVSEPVLAFVGQLTAGKRPERFVDLVRQLRASGARVRGVLVGEGPSGATLEVSAAQAGVSLLGRRDDVPAVLATADLFVFTSRPVGEGMPGVLIEAGLAGLPVVATDVPGVRTVLEDGRTGVVVSVDDFDGLVAATRALIEDPARRIAMGEAARVRCIERFTLQAGGDAWRALFAELTG